MTRFNKIIVLLILIMFFCTLASHSYAEDIIEPGLINNIEKDIEKEDVTGSTNEIITMFAKVIKLIRNIAAIVSVVMISALGVKYMMGSAEEKSGYQKSFIPLIIGIVIIAGALQIISMIFGTA